MRAWLHSILSPVGMIGLPLLLVWAAWKFLHGQWVDGLLLVLLVVLVLGAGESRRRFALAMRKDR